MMKNNISQSNSGLNAAKYYATRAHRKGKRVYILHPQTPGHDWLDEKEALSETIETAKPFAAQEKAIPLANHTAPDSIQVFKTFKPYLPPDWTITNRQTILEIEKDGEIHELVLSDSPLAFVKRQENLDTDHSTLVLGYKDRDGNERTIAVSRDEIVTPQQLLRYFARFPRFPVSRTRAKLLSDFIYESDLHCPYAEMTTSFLGFKNLSNGSKAFAPYSNKVTVEPDSDGYRTILSSITSKGSESAWDEIFFACIEKNPISAVVFAAALAAPLLHLLDVQTFFVHVYGPSSIGKTISFRFAMSIYGWFNGLVHSWSSTLVGVEQLAAFLNNFVVCLDEGSVAKYRKAMSDAIYLLSNEVGKTRGAKTGGTQETKRWRDIVLSNAEADIVDLLASKFAGQGARIISVKGSPLANYDREDAEKIKKTISLHYGHLGPRFINELINCDHDKLRKRYTEFTESLAAQVNGLDPVQGRKAEFYAVLIIALEVLKRIKPDFSKEIEAGLQHLYDHWTILCDQHEERSVPIDALRSLYDYFASNRGKFVSSLFSDRAGTIYKKQPAFLESHWNKILDDSKFSPSNIQAEFEVRGWLQVTKNGKIKVKTSLGKDAKDRHVQEYVIALSEKARKDYDAVYENQDSGVVSDQAETESGTSAPQINTDENENKHENPDDLANSHTPALESDSTSETLIGTLVRIDHHNRELVLRVNGQNDIRKYSNSLDFDDISVGFIVEVSITSNGDVVGLRHPLN